MNSVVSTMRIVRYAVLSGKQDFWATRSIPTWLFGLQLRIFTQVSFFALIGELLGSNQRAHFFLIGNAVVVAAMGSLAALFLTTAERANGVLPLLLASPSRPVIVFASRGLWQVFDGILNGLLAILIAGPVFGLHLPWPRIVVVVPLMALAGLSAYCFSTFLAGLVIRHRELNGLVVNGMVVTLMALCAVNVPLSAYPTWLAWISRCLPITNALQAIRAVFDGRSWSTIGAHTGSEIVVGATWLTLALLTFGRFMHAGQRDGSIEFAS